LTVINRGKNLQMAANTLAASRRPPPKVTAQEVAEMLLRAKAPRPWQDPDGCRVIADCMMTPLSYRHTRRSRLGPEDKPGRNGLCRAQDAIDELRRVLPTIIRRFNDSLLLATGSPGTRSAWRSSPRPAALKRGSLCSTTSRRGHQTVLFDFPPIRNRTLLCFSQCLKQIRATCFIFS
jgi:hypothetical protein